MLDAQDEPKKSLQLPLLYEMIRSFVAVAKHLNLSRAVAELGSTRQTVRRHIAQLEEARGAPLFRNVERRYELTEAGEAALGEAIDILERANAWIKNQTGTTNELLYLQASAGEWDYFQQQQPLGAIWQSDTVLLRETLRAWTMAAGEIESPHLSHVRPYLMVYRHSDSGWLTVEFGERCAYVKWFGLDYARSSIGRPLARMPAGVEFGTMMDRAFHDVQVSQSVRLDHVYTHMPRPDSAGLAPMAYQRLLMAGFFPDGSSAVLSLVVPTAKPNIPGLSEEKKEGLAEIEPADFSVGDARLSNTHV